MRSSQPIVSSVSEDDGLELDGPSTVNDDETSVTTADASDTNSEPAKVDDRSQTEILLLSEMLAQELDLPQPAAA